MNDADLRIYILKLEKELKDSKEKLFLDRLCRLCRLYNKNLSDTLAYQISNEVSNEVSNSVSDEVSNSVSDIKINIDQANNNWSISYTHYTNNYNVENYNVYTYDNDRQQLQATQETDTEQNINQNTNTDQETDTTQQTNENISIEHRKNKTLIIFGKSKKYFIKGGYVPYNIYKNSAGELRIINSEYDLELDMDEQYELINSYASNINIPECLALSVFLYLADNKWDDLNLITYLSVV